MTGAAAAWRRLVAACTPRALLMAAIRLYKRRVSPRKGWSCACRVHAGRCSCSSFGLRAIGRHGALRGLGLLRLRLAACGELGRRHARPRHAPARVAQAGFVDCDLPCDLSAGSGCCGPDAACSAIADTCDVTGCCDVDAGCDWPGSKRGRRKAAAQPRVWEPGPGG